MSDNTFLIEQENALLGILLTTTEMPQVREEVVAIVQCDDFSPRGRVIFQAIQAHNGRPVDVLTVTDFLQEKNLLESAGGESFLFDLAAAMPPYIMAPEYAKNIAERGEKRRRQEKAERTWHVSCWPVIPTAHGLYWTGKHP